VRLRLTGTAAPQLDHLLTDITRQHPPGAGAVLLRIDACLELVLRHPYADQMTDRRGIRRIVVSPYPYLMTYRVSADEVVVRTIRHAARRPLARATCPHWSACGRMDQCLAPPGVPLRGEPL
jgi:plasmid stabilization system protein ParE